MQFSTSDDPIEYGDFKIIPSEMCVVIDGESIELTHAMMGALYMMAKTPGRVFERREMITALYGLDHPSGERSLDKLICLLKRRTGIKAIKCVRGVGYKLPSRKKEEFFKQANADYEALADSLSDVLED